MTKDDEAWGCGISKWWLTSANDPLSGPCKWHDAAYQKGSSAQDVWTRKEVDNIFFQMMRGIARDEQSYKLLLRARLYYYTARLLGARYWEGKK